VTVLGEGWRRTRERVGGSTATAVAIALAAWVLTVALLNRFDVGDFGVQLAVALMPFVAFFTVSLAAVARQLERDREQCRRDFEAVERRIGIANHVRSIVEGIERDLAPLMPRPRFYAGARQVAHH